MKRLLPAAVLAILFHMTLFSVEVSRFTDEKIALPKSTCVTVTMSYRRPAPVVRKKRPIKQDREIRKHEKIKLERPIKVPEKPKPFPCPRQTAVKPDDRKSSPSEKIKDVIEPDESGNKPLEADIPEISHGDNVSNMRVRQEVVPLYQENPPPEYPGAARRRGYQGIVLLSVLVNEQGKVENLWVSDSSGYRLLDNAAIRAVKNWFFVPGKIGGKNVKMWVRIPVRFQLK